MEKDTFDLYSEAPDFFNVNLKENKISNQNQNNKNNRNEAEQFEFNIFGSEQLQIRTKAILEEFSDIFDIKLRSQPAKIKPYELKVDKLKWEKPINRLPPRPQTLAKNNAIMKFIQQSLEIDLIEPSQSAHWSQLNLRPKKDPDEYRITCDFRNINLATELMKWPLPNIPAMLQRIGSKKAKYFAVLDLTAGYHQVPISVDSRDFTSFRTLDGLYKFKRLPMGLTNAAAYFQQMMVTVVLAGLIYSMLENYLDDLIIFGETEEEYLLRLTTVLGRLKQFDIVLNPKKCRFNLARVEYVGHVINHEGLHFSEEKLNNMLLYEKPIYQRQLKSFLGLASYFRDHIKNHSILVYDLQRLIEPYNPKKKIIWTEETSTRFFEVRTAVAECPKLFFIDENAPVTLCTDACDYGVGAYLFQTIDGKEQPISFLSKSLNKTQLKWSTIEKECYAIFWALYKLDYLIRDIEFLLKTDHANLTFLNTNSKQKVQRWKLSILQYNFDLEYFEAIKNNVADDLSRINMPDDVTEDELLTLCPLMDSNTIPRDKYKLISAVHNSRVGHFGVEKTINKLDSQNYNWPDRLLHVKQFVRQCPCCQKMSKLKIPITTHPFTLAAYGIMDRINVDTIGPLPMDDNGNQYIVAIIDCFSRFIELYPVKDTSAPSAAVPLVDFSGRYGIPAEVLTDNGTQYANQLMKELENFVSKQS